MRIICNLATAAAMMLSIVPAVAFSDADKRDCEQMTKPVTKVTACTRILGDAKLTKEMRVFAIHHRGVGLLLQHKLDDAIVEFNEALRLDPTFVRSYNSRGNAWRGKGEIDNAIADYNEAIRIDPNFAFPYNGRAAAFDDKGPEAARRAGDEPCLHDDYSFT